MSQKLVRKKVLRPQDENEGQLGMRLGASDMIGWVVVALSHVKKYCSYLDQSRFSPSR